MTPSIYWFLLFALVIPGMGLGFRSALLAKRMTEQLNAVLPQAQKFGKWWQYFPKERRRFFEARQSAFPNDSLKMQYRVVSALSWIFTVLILFLTFGASPNR